MAQTTDYEIANSSGLVFRGRVNEVFAAVQSSNSGATAPTDIVGGMLWLDTSVSPAVLRRRNSADSAWLAVFSVDNILGTVSQSAGVPTGAIIESGSNANGEFAKFADGTMICWNYALTAQSSTAATGSMFRTTAVSTWTFPVAFLVAPVVSGQADNSARFMAIELPTTTTVDFRQFSATTSSGSIGVRLQAIGQWF